MDEGQHSVAATGSPPPTRRGKVLAGIAAFLVGTAVVWQAVVTGIFGLLGNDPAPADTPADTPADCGEFPVDVGYPSEPAGATAQVTFDTRCAPDEGREFITIIEAKDIGSDKHSEYYPKEVALTSGKTDTIAIDIGDDPDGQINCVFVLHPTHAQAQQLLSNLTAGNFALHLPDAIPRASKPACGRTRHEGTTATPSSSAQAAPKPGRARAVFDLPRDGARINYGSNVSLEGSVSGLGAASLWLVTKPDAGDGYYFLTQNSALAAVDGRWAYVDSEVGDESDSGRNITYLAIKADATCASVLTTADETVKPLPPTCVVLATRPVHVN